MWIGTVDMHARIEQFRTDGEAFTSGLAVGTRRAKAYTAGLTWWHTRHIRSTADVIYTDFNDRVVVGNRTSGKELGLVFRLQYEF